MGEFETETENPGSMYRVISREEFDERMDQKSIFHEINRQMESLSKSATLDLLRDRLENAPSQDELNELLIRACESSKWSLQHIQCIIEAGADPHCSDEEPLMSSCDRDGDDFSIVAYFLNEHDADINVCDGILFTCAFNNENFTICRKLLESGLILSELDDTIEECEYNREELIKILMESGIEPERILPKLFSTGIKFDDHSPDFMEIYTQAKKYLSREDLGDLLVKTFDELNDKKAHPEKYASEYELYNPSDNEESVLEESDGDQSENDDQPDDE